MSTLNSGDTCITLNDEQDIETIPAGTQVKLISMTGSACWNCRGTINGVERPLLILANNLQKVEWYFSEDHLKA